MPSGIPDFSAFAFRPASPFASLSSTESAISLVTSSMNASNASSVSNSSFCRSRICLRKPRDFTASSSLSCSRFMFSRSDLCCDLKRSSALFSSITLFLISALSGVSPASAFFFLKILNRPSVFTLPSFFCAE